jgi:Putative transposase
VVPAGGPTEDRRTWKPCRPGFFLPVRVLSRLFRGKFVAGLRVAFRDGRLDFHGRLARYQKPDAFEQFLREAWSTEWVVYTKPPFDGPEPVLK